MTAMIAWKPKLGKIRRWKLASARYRCLLPCQYLQKMGYPCEVFKPNQMEQYKIVVFQKLYDLEHIELAQRLKRQGTKLVFDLCDNVFYNPDNLAKNNTIIAHLKRLLDLVDVITVSTNELKRYVALETDKPIKVIDDIIEDPTQNWTYQVISQFPFNQTRESPLKIVWYGTAGPENPPSGIVSIAKIIPYLDQLNAQIPLVLTIISNSYSLCQKYTQGVSFPVKYYQWHQLTFPYLFKQQDICIIPVELNPYTICKTNNRLVMSLLLGIPVIAESLPSYLEFKDYVLLDNWYSNLSTYALNPQLSQQHVKKGQEYIRSHYNPDRAITQWSDLFKMLLSS